MANGLYQDKYRIASARRTGYDYSQDGGYFVTICTQNRTWYFGEVVPAADALTDAYLTGTALANRAQECWQQMPEHFSFVKPDALVIMPDHVHGILFIRRAADDAPRVNASFGAQSSNLAAVVRGFKVGVKAWATRQGLDFAWQPGYYDRVIRNEKELEKIRRYIGGNLNQWAEEAGNEGGLFR